MSVLDELWYGNISPFEQYLDGNEKYKELLPIMAKDREMLSSELSVEQSEWLAKYDAILGEMNSTAEVEAFKHGFRLAIGLLMETRT